MNEQMNLEPKKTWLQSMGIFGAWVGGLTGGATLLVAIVMLIADLFAADRLFTFYNFSNGLFWAFVALMVTGLIAPTMGSWAKSAESDGQGEKAGEQKIKRTLETAPTAAGKKPLHLSGKEIDRVRQAARKRIARVYNPWPWRFWAASLVVFGIAVLSGL